MGYVEEPVYITLSFTGKREGLIVEVREPSTDEWETLILPLLAHKDDPHKFTDAFCRMLHTWNLELKDGSPVPLTREGFRSQNIRFTGTVLRAWINNAIVVADDEEAHESDSMSLDPFEDTNVHTLELPPLEVMEVGA